MKKWMPLASPSLDACVLLNISEEVPWGSSPSLGFCSFSIFLHHLALGYLKTFFTQNLQQLHQRGQSTKTISSFSSKAHIMNLFFYNISYCHKGISKSPALKKLHSARERSNAKLRTKSVKNRTDCKDEFFWDNSGPQIRNLKTRERQTKP